MISDSVPCGFCQEGESGRMISGSVPCCLCQEGEPRHTISDSVPCCLFQEGESRHTISDSVPWCLCQESESRHTISDSVPRRLCQEGESGHVIRQAPNLHPKLWKTVMPNVATFHGTACPWDLDWRKQSTSVNVCCRAHKQKTKYAYLPTCLRQLTCSTLFGKCFVA